MVERIRNTQASANWQREVFLVCYVRIWCITQSFNITEIINALRPYVLVTLFDGNKWTHLILHNNRHDPSRTRGVIRISGFRPKWVFTEWVVTRILYITEILTHILYITEIGITGSYCFPGHHMLLQWDMCRYSYTSSRMSLVLIEFQYTSGTKLNFLLQQPSTTYHFSCFHIITLSGSWHSGLVCWFIRIKSQQIHKYRSFCPQHAKCF